eukprot:scaffold82775_cov36-Phaeocystis_antarctica.AAC.1
MAQRSRHSFVEHQQSFADRSRWSESVGGSPVFILPLTAGPTEGGESRCWHGFDSLINAPVHPLWTLHDRSSAPVLADEDILGGTDEWGLRRASLTTLREESPPPYN